MSCAADGNVQWTFAVELAPCVVGFYERLICVVKRYLRNAIGRVCLSNEQLLTILKEAEAVVNSRPTVYVVDDVNSHITLTPAQFIQKLECQTLLIMTQMTLRKHAYSNI